ncbi:competence protein ComEC [Sphingopyxis lindanitolerans]|uniref:Competence protein ComEC n=1 Tax=Sphingopyxis lindanitolerans TaxID=2054227 RepID=A0A2S8B5B7_9SPHN|nr:ComEC/Rec2 family competence protein [Sphingopyxis lindanitolerans]PQM27604.1 competence protein ComEC [Sphingopyxis lindanitolerans]
MATRPLQTPICARAASRLRRVSERIEAWLDAERERIGLWLPVALGAGIAFWFALPTVMQWIGLLFLLAAGTLAGVLAGWQRRLGRIAAIGCAAMAAGILLIWIRALWLAAPVLAQPAVTAFSAQIEAVEPLPARGQTRLIARPLRRSDLPPRVRLTMRDGDSGDIAPGDFVGLRARLMPPPTASLPGGYDFAQRAWFDRIGAVGTVLGDVARRPGAKGGSQPLRARLSAHIHGQVAGSPGGIAAALVTGDRGAISPEDDEAMRRAGLAHLLSISGLHVTAVIGFAMLVAMRLFALSRRLALEGYVLPIAAAAGALAGAGYTWLAGAEVPTLRSLIAALLVLVAFLMGREALTLRLVAAGALIVLLWRPESLAGPSFQLSFAAVTAIVALHESPTMRRFLARRDEGLPRRWGRGLAGLLITGLVVEVALAPIALFHFHKAGLYGALANVVAIPLTTFVIMPMEAAGLLFDSIGIGAPFWWVADHALRLLIALAHAVAGTPGAVATLPIFPRWGFALTVGGGLWILLWRTRWRRAGAVPLAIGIAALLAQPRPDLLITGDGRNIAAAAPGGGYALLRDRAGDFVRDTMREAAGIDTPLGALADLDHVECNVDFCRWRQGVDGAQRVILASRGRDRIEGADMAAACDAADVVISDRWLPRECVGRWLTIGRDSLAESGGLAIYLAGRPRVVAVRRAGDEHPWRQPDQLSGNDEAVPTSALAP